MIKRIKTLDVFRGLALVFIIFFHTSIYNFANIHKIDFSNPPIIVIIVSFLTLWGGIFILYSGFVNAYATTQRLDTIDIKRQTKFLIITAFVFFITHVLLTTAFGRWANDFEHNQPVLPAIPMILRSGEFTLPSVTTLFKGSSLSTISINLLVISFVLRIILHPKRIKNLYRNLAVLGITSVAIILLSFVRIDLYPFFEQRLSEKNVLSGMLFGVLLANAYPILPYITYGIFGTILGILYAKKDMKIILVTFVPLALAFITLGFIGFTKHPKTISTPDYFWYYKTQLELGLFLLIMTFALFMEKFKIIGIGILRELSRITLTIYMLETLVSEILRHGMFKINSNWNQTMNGTFVFGGINLLLWILIALIWKKYNYKYSLEYWWVKLAKKLGKESTKLQSEM